MREIIFVMAGLEREQIGEATKARLASAKEAGKHIGRNNSASRKQIKRVRELRAQGLGYQAITRSTHLSYGTVWAIINNRGVYGSCLGTRKNQDDQLQPKVDEEG
jgi:DNA invertase Pin-like site-specific DNA recombinase